MAERHRGQVRIASHVVAVMAAVCLLAGLPLAAASETVSRTVLLVSGYMGAASGFDRMQAGLRVLGIPSVEVILPGQDNVANADVIRGVVQRIVRARGPGTSVDIVAHSMGGLSSRWYARFLGGSAGTGDPLVAHLVALGTPEYGLPGACLLPLDLGGQMCPTSSFLAQLNSGDDTPGRTAYTTIFSTDDGLVPISASRLDGGACFVRDTGVGHFGLRTDPTVFAQVVSALRGHCPGVMEML